MDKKKLAIVIAVVLAIALGVAALYLYTHREEPKESAKSEIEEMETEEEKEKTETVTAEQKKLYSALEKTVWQTDNMTVYIDTTARGYSGEWCFYPDNILYIKRIDADGDEDEVYFENTYGYYTVSEDLKTLTLENQNGDEETFSIEYHGKYQTASESDKNASGEYLNIAPAEYTTTNGKSYPKSYSEKGKLTRRSGVLSDYGSTWTVFPNPDDFM